MKSIAKAFLVIILFWVHLHSCDPELADSRLKLSQSCSKLWKDPILSGSIQMPPALSVQVRAKARFSHPPHQPGALAPERQSKNAVTALSSEPMRTERRSAVI